MNRKSLINILRDADRESLAQSWVETEAAEEFAPLPPGEYVARIVGGELFTSRINSTPGYKLRFRVLEGDHAGRHFWLDIWLTPAALPMAKRDLGKIGVTSLEQLEECVPPGIRCSVTLANRRDDDGNVYSRVTRFEVVGIDEPDQDVFAPADDPAPRRIAADESAGGHGG
jgi:hypothetical protein